MRKLTFYISKNAIPKKIYLIVSTQINPYIFNRKLYEATIK